MPSNPITPQEQYDILINRSLTPRDGSTTETYMAAGYILMPPATVDGAVKWRLFDAAYIKTGIIDPNRLGTGSTGAGNLYLADDGTWKIISAGGGGDMLRATYDVDNDGVVDSAERTEIIVRNSTGTTLTKGTVVYLSGATGNRPNAVRAQANTEATSSKTIGIVVANINNNADGYVATNGTLHDLDTSAFTAGDAVWLSAATAGAFTSTVPAEPNHAVFIGYIARAHPTQGRIVLHFQNGYEFDELHGVLLSSPANNDLVVYESSTSLWKNKSISTIFGGTPLVSVPTLDQVTTAGNTTTNAITVGSVNLGSSVAVSTFSGFGLNYFIVTALTAGQGISAGFLPSGTPTGYGYNFQFNKSSTANSNSLLIIGGGSAAGGNAANKHVISTSADGTALGQPLVLRVAPASTSWSVVNDHFTIFPTGNVVIQNASSSATDAGYKLDVNGTGRYSSTLTIQTTASSGSPSNSILITTSDAGNGGRISWGDSNTSILRTSNQLYFREYSGNFVFETTASSSILFAVRPATTTVSSGKFITNGSTTAASLLAQGVYFNNTLVAAANNDVLVGLDINPTFTNGAFTGVENIHIRSISAVNATVVKNIFLKNTGIGGGSGVSIGFNNTANNNLFNAFIKSYYTSGMAMSFGTGGGPTLNAEGTVALVLNADQTANFTGKVTVNSGGLQVTGTSANMLMSDNGTPVITRNGGSGIQFLKDAYWQTFSVFTNNVENLRVASTGNVLIGTTTDAGYKLDVNGTTRVQGFTTVSATTLVNGDAALTVQSTTNNSVVGQLYGINNIVTASTNVSNISGINSAVNTSSSASLMAAVQGQVNISANTLTEGKGFTTNPAATGTGTFTRYIGFDNLAVFTAGSGSVGTQIFLRSQYLNVAANNIGLLLQDAAAATVVGNWAIHDQTGYGSYFKGSIGIGTTTLTRQLNISGTNPVILLNATAASYAGINLKSSAGNLYVALDGSTPAFGTANASVFWSDINAPMIFAVLNAERVRIHANGNFAIGTTTDAGYKLDVVGTARVSGDLTVDTNTLFVDATNDRVGIGTNAPNHTLQVYRNTSAGYLASFNSGATLNTNASLTIRIENSNLPSIQALNAGAGGFNTFALNPLGGNILVGTTTDAGYKLDVNGTARVSGALTATSFVKSGGTALQYLLADGSVKTTTSDTNFIRYGDYITGKNYPGVTATLNAQVIRDDFYGFNARWTQTDTYTGTYPNAGSTWIRTYELITGENYVYPSGNMYFGFWTNYPPANITVRTWSPTAGVWQGPYTGSDIRIGGGGFAFWKIPIGGNNFVTKFEVTFTPQPGLSINLQSQDLIIDYAEGVDASPIVGRGGSSMYGALSFKTASATNVTINTNGVVNLLYLRPSNSSGIIEFQNSAGTKAGSMFMDGTIWRFKSQNNSDTLNIFANGNLGIKQTTDAGYVFDVNGTSRLNGAVTATLANVSTANVVYYNSSTGLMTYATAPVGAQFKIDYDPNITGTKNGVNLLFTTSATFIVTTTRVFLNGQRLTRGATYDYVETGTNQITFAAAPLPTDQLIIEYQI